ncbi:MAG: DJ-1/PfpI family protein [Acholeplasmatales bacterium]|nr:DJ-1/PfpI family protein [Acholeplasmatales bacterium]
MNILFLINDGFEETETTAPYDVLKRAGYNVVIASNKTKAIGAHGIVFDNLIPLSNIKKDDYDMLVLPGGPQWKANSTDKSYLDIMTYFAQNKKIAAICASPTIMGDHGLLKGKKYTCFPPMHKDSCGGEFTGGPAEIDGNIITGRSAGSSLEFGFKIVEALEGKEKAKSVADGMYY